MSADEARFPEPKNLSWDHITFAYTFENARLVPSSFETDGFITEDEIEELDLWEITVIGSLYNFGAEPDAQAIKAVRFNGKVRIEEPIKGALAAHLEWFINRPGPRSLIRNYALEHGEKHYRREAA